MNFILFFRFGEGGLLLVPLPWLRHYLLATICFLNEWADVQGAVNVTPRWALCFKCSTNACCNTSVQTEVVWTSVQTTSAVQSKDTPLPTATAGHSKLYNIRKAQWTNALAAIATAALQPPVLWFSCWDFPHYVQWPSRNSCSNCTWVVGMPYHKLD